MKYQVKRSITIKAPLKKVRPFIEDFKHWESWSPWSIIEPGHKQKIKGDTGEIGHQMTWNGKIIGSGTNEIVAFEGNSIIYDLNFIKPFKSFSKVRFDFKKVKAGTKVTWIMDSSMPFFLFFMIPKMRAWIGMDYDRGLTMLKTLIEDGKIPAKTTNEGLKKFEGFSYVGIKKTSTKEKMPKEMGKAFDDLMNTLQKEGKKAKHWVSIYPKVNMAKQEFTYIAAASAENLDGVELPKNYIRGEIKTQKMLQIMHKGPYTFLGNAWSMGMMTLQAKKIKQNGIPFEYYWNHPKKVQAKNLKTSIFFPVKG